MTVSKICSAAALVAVLGSSAGTPLATHRVFWNQTLADLAMVSVCINTAAMASVDGDLIRAAQVLGRQQKFADSAAQSLRGVPADWRGAVGAGLSRAALELGAAGSALRVYLAHGKVADLKTAQSDQAKAAAELVAAGSEAKSAYAAMGGNASDLETVPHALQNATVALASAMGDTDTDDQ
jgi:hypothetical protein